MGSFKLSLELQDPNKREPTMLCVDDDVSMDGVLALRTKECGPDVLWAGPALLLIESREIGEGP